jgi:hypothetical protein
MSALGPKADVTLLNFDVRFTPESGHPMRHSECPLWANSGLMHCNKIATYSITSSARASKDCGTDKPSAFGGK